MERIQAAIDYLTESEHRLEHYLLSDDHIDLVEAAPWVISSAIMWAVLHNIFHEQSKYAVSTFHSVALSFVGALNLVFIQHNKYEYLVFYFMAGYFLADFFISAFMITRLNSSVHKTPCVTRTLNSRNKGKLTFDRSFLY